MIDALSLLPAFSEFHWLPADYWDLSIPVYLYLAVLAGGAYLAGVSALAVRSRRGAGPRAIESDVARWGFLVAVVGAAGAGLAVLSHLAVIYRAIFFPIYLTNFGSWITIGTWILVLLSLLAVVSLLFQLFGDGPAADDGASLFPRAIAAKLGVLEALDRLVDRARPSGAVMAAMYALGSLLALGTVYTGFELAIVETVPLWNQPVLLPLAFLTSGVAAGVGLAVALTMAFEREFAPLIGGYALAVGVLSGISLALVWYGWTSIATSDAPAAAASYANLTSGGLYAGVWLVALGFLVPLLLGVAIGAATVLDRLSPTIERLAGPALIGSFGLLFVGALALRIVLLLAAEQDPVVVVGL